MPTYEYQCATCNHRFEKFQSFSDEPVKTCPECGQLVKKVFTPTGIIFKGSGWYINDSKKTAPTGDAKAASKDSAKTETTAAAGESKTETAASGSETKSESPSKPGKSEAAA